MYNVMFNVLRCNIMLYHDSWSSGADFSRLRQPEGLALWKLLQLPPKGLWSLPYLASQFASGLLSRQINSVPQPVQSLLSETTTPYTEIVPWAGWASLGFRIKGLVTHQKITKAQEPCSGGTIPQVVEYNPGGGKGGKLDFHLNFDHILDLQILDFNRLFQFRSAKASSGLIKLWSTHLVLIAQTLRPGRAKRSHGTRPVLLSSIENASSVRRTTEKLGRSMVFQLMKIKELQNLVKMFMLISPQKKLRKKVSWSTKSEAGTSPWRIYGFHPWREKMPSYWRSGWKGLVQTCSNFLLVVSSKPLWSFGLDFVASGLEPNHLALWSWNRFKRQALPSTASEIVGQATYDQVLYTTGAAGARLVSRWNRDSSTVPRSFLGRMGGIDLRWLGLGAHFFVKIWMFLGIWVVIYMWKFCI